MSKDPDMESLRARKQESDRHFVTQIMRTLNSDFAYREYAARIRKNYPHLGDLAAICEQKAQQAAKSRRDLTN